MSEQDATPGQVADARRPAPRRLRADPSGAARWVWIWLAVQACTAAGLGVAAWVSRGWSEARQADGCFEWCGFEHALWLASAVVLAGWALLVLAAAAALGWRVAAWSIVVGSVAGALLWLAVATASGGGTASITWPALVPAAVGIAAWKLGRAPKERTVP